MIKTLIFSVFFLTFLPVLADRKGDYNKLKEVLTHNGIEIRENIDTIATYKGYPVKIKQKQDSIIHIGLNLFNPEWSQVIDEDLLGFIERDLLLQIASENYEDSKIVFNVGKLSDMKKIDTTTSCNINIIDSNRLMVEWYPENGNNILISVPVSYDVLRGATRGEIEEAFISQLKESDSNRNIDIEIDLSRLEPYGETDYILPGASYINDKITRNVYLYSTDDSSFIWDKEHPIESISNLFIGGAGRRDTYVDLTVMKHDYGEKEQIKTSLENLLAIAEMEGCVPYWGVERHADGKITGSLFLYNPRQGYDHVLKIECVPEDIIEGEGSIKAKAYLYIPTNNVSNLNEPYRVKTEDEKIKYWDN